MCPARAGTRACPYICIFSDRFSSYFPNDQGIKKRRETTMNRFRYLLMVLLTVSALTLAGCDGGGGGAPASPPGDGEPTPTPSLPGSNLVSLPLGQLQGSTFSAAVDVSDNGQHVVGMADDIQGDLHAVHWEIVDGTAVGPERLELLTGGTFGSAYSVNAGAQIVGESEDTDLNVQAVLWLGPTGSPTVLPTLAAGRFNAAYGINDGGMIVGESEEGGSPHAVAWIVDANGVLQAGPIRFAEPAGATSSTAYFVNGSLQAVGEYATAAGTSQAILWTLNPDGTTATMTDLPALPGHVETVAHALNDLNQAVGESKGADGVSRAVVWDISVQPPGVPVDISDAAAGGNAVAINAGGRTAGWTVAADGANQASIWNVAAPDPTVFGSIAGAAEGFGEAYGLNAAGDVVGLAGTQAFLAVEQ